MYVQLSMWRISFELCGYRGVHVDIEQLAQSFQSPARVRFYCSQWHIGRCGDLLLRTAFEQGHFQHQPFFGPQKLHGMKSFLRFLARFYRPSFVARAAGKFFDQRLPCGESRLPALSIDQPPPGDHGYECCFRGQCRIEAFGVAPYFDKDFLDGILQVGMIFNAAPGERPDQAAIPVDTFIHSRRIARRDSL